ncbi:purine catabolism regulator [Thermosporothrix hazakensis]|jgi:purine catabolism regulator|uniref:Purine catabolism regulator n=1 Tax=Thermosporothrix hazakensis TaxID=644383 RepID=A0A326UDF6_THEHA|nr:helix-turn-helix domain-containing protein [Thermosporothrix hazakensis]PZW36074.1 purine catabolism regulator [Thermosporothrix hazakensis]GCE46725.1 CdaR family transcriptional regulator [Thermosporothrix hazakensis]
MSSLPPSISSASVRNILTLLASREAQLVAGSGGLERRVTWACRMRVRLPAFESVQGGELALLALSQLRRLDETLPRLLKSLQKAGVAAVGVAAPDLSALDPEAISFADQQNFPLILLPANSHLEEIEREVITFVVSFRGEIERKATEIAHHLMQLSVQGAGIQGVCDYLAQSREKWVIVQDSSGEVRVQATPDSARPLELPASFSDDFLHQRSLTRITEPIQIRHEVVGSISLIGPESDFDFLERIILGQVVPVLALEVARERERSEVENRYLVEAFTNIIRGTYQSTEEMLARARILGYDLAQPEVVAIFELAEEIPDFRPGDPAALWGRRIREELQRDWRGCWILVERRRVLALLPASVADENEREKTIYTRLERIFTRTNKGTPLSCGIGRIANTLEMIPQSYREAQRALEIGRRLFGEGKIHSFARLGIYRLLFHLDGHSELDAFYRETLGPLLQHDSRQDETLIETLDSFFHCNGNLSETARMMHLHRNSLLYRLGRIEELLGHSLEDADFRLSLQIALKIHQVHKR